MKMKKTKCIVISVLVMVFIVAGILFYLFTPKNPSEEQLKKDFLEQIVQYEVVDVSQFVIVDDII